MNRRGTAVAAVAVLCCLLLVVPSLGDAQEPAIDWWVVAGGGGAASGSGGVALLDTLGQPIIGPSSHDGTWLEAGYWGGLGGGYRIYLPLTLRNS
jgi:hypothetical protein